MIGGAYPQHDVVAFSDDIFWLPFFLPEIAERIYRVKIPLTILDEDGIHASSNKKTRRRNP